MAKSTPKVPGEEGAPTAGAPEKEDGAGERVDARVTALNNTTGRTANDVGAEREDVVRAQAMADAARRGEKPDLAPPADIGAPAPAASTKREAIINGHRVLVDVPVIRKNDAVEKFGHESKLPPGTLVNKDGSAFEASDKTPEAFGVIGHIDTPQGKLVNRIIPFDAMKPAA